MKDNFYHAFEDRYRGSRELIKSRLRAYLPFIQALGEHYPASPALDLGCGRGEWLEVLATAGFIPTGIDLDEGMLSTCHDLGLTVIPGEAVAYLSGLPDNSQTVVSAFHVVEHIHFDDVRRLVFQAHRVLKSGGLLIMETPNSENIVVATHDFYLDPTHQRPIPPELLSFVPEFYGFKRIKTIRLQESKELSQQETPLLQNVFGGASPDYAVVAQKDADPALLAFTAMAFEREYGLTLETLSARYDSATQLKIQQAETKVEQAGAQAQQAETKAEQAEAQAQQAESLIHQSHGELLSRMAELLAAQERYHALEKTLADMSAQNHYNWQLAESRAVEIDAMTAQVANIQQLLVDSQHAYAEAQALLIQKLGEIEYWHGRVLQLHASTSWRITKPLRYVKRLLTSKPSTPTPAQASDAQENSFLFRGRHALRTGIAHGIRYVFLRPHLRSGLSRALKTMPWLHQRLLRLGVNTGAIPYDGLALPGRREVAATDEVRVNESTESAHSTPQQASFSATIDGIPLTNMSPRTRQIYHGLKAAIGHTKVGC